jgi:serine/threonine protein kinase
MGACTVPGKMMIVTELMRGDLERLILEEQVNLSMLTRMKMARDAALGMLWLHSSNPQIIHRDLKASNLLVDDNLNCKICDFGLSQFTPKGKHLIDGKEGAKGTPLWMAPEVMMGEPFNEKADVYSFGLILWFLLTKHEPYEDYDELESFTRDICVNRVRPFIPNDCDPSLRELIVKCWDHNPQARPKFSEIITRIEHIMVDLAIEDKVGRTFWKRKGNEARKQN